MARSRTGGRTAPRALLLDLGGVLLMWDDERTVAHVARALGAPVASVRHALLSRRVALHRGDLTLREFWAGVSDELGVPLPAAWRTLWSERLAKGARPNMGAVRMAQEVRKGGSLVGIFSNTDPSHARIFGGWPWFRALRPHFLSFELGVVKPEPRAYGEVRRRLGVPAGRIVFVDDRPENVEGAARAGWRAYRYRTLTGLRADLQREGLLPARGPA